MIKDCKISTYIDNRYKEWNNDLGKFIHDKNNNMTYVIKSLILCYR